MLASIYVGDAFQALIVAEMPPMPQDEDDVSCIRSISCHSVDTGGDAAAESFGYVKDTYGAPSLR